MNKFYAYVIWSNSTVQRVWMGNSDVIAALNEHKSLIILRDSQQAMIVNEELMWKDIKGQDSLSGTEK